MGVLLHLAVHQGEEPVLLAEKNHNLRVRTSKVLQINSTYPQKLMLLVKYSRQLREAYHA